MTTDGWSSAPSDLVGFLQCGHLSELSLEVAHGTRSGPSDDDHEQSVVQRRGDEHEEAYLARLRAEGLEVTEIPASDELETRAALTTEALAAGPDVVYQATFVDRAGSGPIWRGHADFLTRVTAPSSLGAFSYEPEDTKLATHVRPSAVLQLCEYAEQLARGQGRVPDQIHVVLGDQTRVSLRLADFAAYHRAAKERFVAACADGVSAYPLPVEHCHVCQWRSQCDERRIADDHLTLVPGLRTDQVGKLTAGAGVTTVAELAAYEGDGVPGIGRQAFDKLRAQARLQVRAREEPDLAPPTSCSREPVPAGVWPRCRPLLPATSSSTSRATPSSGSRASSTCSAWAGPSPTGSSGSRPSGPGPRPRRSPPSSRSWTSSA